MSPATASRSGTEAPLLDAQVLDLAAWDDLGRRAEPAAGPGSSTVGG